MIVQLPEYEQVGTVGDNYSAVTAATIGDVSRAVARGYAPENIFFLPSAASDLLSLPQDCRPVASSLAQLCNLNQLAAQIGGPLRSVGLRLAPDGFASAGGIRVAHLPDIAKVLPYLTAITVRGCFVGGELNGLHGKTLGRFFRACYESAKQMTVTLPCAMPYLCVEGGLTALEANRIQHPETLGDAITAAQIVAMQNSTAFYARLLIS